MLIHTDILKHEIKFNFTFGNMIILCEITIIFYSVHAEQGIFYYEKKQTSNR